MSYSKTPIKLTPKFWEAYCEAFDKASQDDVQIVMRIKYKSAKKIRMGKVNYVSPTIYERMQNLINSFSGKQNVKGWTMPPDNNGVKIHKIPARFQRDRSWKVYKKYEVMPRI